jgi:hypothetical protein
MLTQNIPTDIKRAILLYVTYNFASYLKAKSIMYLGNDRVQLDNGVILTYVFKSGDYEGELIVDDGVLKKTLYVENYIGMLSCIIFCNLKEGIHGLIKATPTHMFNPNFEKGETIEVKFSTTYDLVVR